MQPKNATCSSNRSALTLRRRGVPIYGGVSTIRVSHACNRRVEVHSTLFTLQLRWSVECAGKVEVRSSASVEAILNRHSH